MYKPETKWEIDENLVYNLRQEGYYKSKPLMVNGVVINITAIHTDKEDKELIAKIICDALNAYYFKPGEGD